MKTYAAAWLVMLASCANADQDKTDAARTQDAPSIERSIAGIEDGLANPQLTWRGPRRIELHAGPAMVMVADQNPRDPKGYFRLMTVTGTEGHVISLVRTDCAPEASGYRVLRQYTARTAIDRHVESRGGSIAIAPEDVKAILCADRSKGTVARGRASTAEEKARNHGKAKTRKAA